MQVSPEVSVRVHQLLKYLVDLNSHLGVKFDESFQFGLGAPAWIPCGIAFLPSPSITFDCFSSLWKVITDQFSMLI